VKTTQFCSWLIVGLVGTAIGCITGSGGSPGLGAGSGGISASGGKQGSGGVSGSGGATGTGGAANHTGGQGSGGVVGSAGAQTGGNSGTGGVATGGVPATGGQGSGGKNAGGSTGTGGVATGGNSTSTGGQSTGGSTGSGGKATGGATSAGGSAFGGATGIGGQGGNAGNAGTTGTPDASTSAYRPCPADGTACKIMPFGDSITDGYNVDTPGGYRVELFRLAHSAGKSITFVGSGWNGPDTVDGAPFPHNHEGHSGWTIAPAGGRSGISTLVADAMPKYTPHIVLLMIGTNDCIDNYQLATAPTRLKDLIDSIYAKLPDVLIVVAQPVPSRGDASKGDDTSLSDRIKAFNATLPAVVKAQADAGKHILLVDMFTPFDPKKASLMEDQWHPNLAGYVLLGTQWYSVLKSLL